MNIERKVMSKLIYKGKTKDVYDNKDGTYTLKLKDNATGKDGVFDPGANIVCLQIQGLGRASLMLSRYYFEMLGKAGIPHHYIDADVPATAMRIKPAAVFGKGVEFICRYRADGGFLRRYGAYASFGAILDYFVEVTLKDDERGDPPISKDALVLLQIMTSEEYEVCKTLTGHIAGIIAADLETKGLELYDMKVEFGKSDTGVMLIDEISAGCMRVYRNGTPVAPMELTPLILGEGC